MIECISRNCMMGVRVFGLECFFSNFECCFIVVFVINFRWDVYVDVFG